MYGASETSTGGAILAVTGAAVSGAWVLGAVGLILAGIALYLLFRKNGEHKP